MVFPKFRQQRQNKTTLHNIQRRPERAKPICEKCGLGCYAGAYSGLFLSDGEWLRMFKIAKNTKNRLFSDFIYERVYFRFDVVEVG
jgi:hypothetical protein